MSKVKSWADWRAASRIAATTRWTELSKLLRPKMSGKDWLTKTRSRLIDLATIGILLPREQSRIRSLDFDEIGPSDRDRIVKKGVPAGKIFAFAVAAGDGQSLSRSTLSLSPGKRLREGKLSFQVFIDTDLQVPIGMNIQVRGIDPARGNRSTYMRYDLDVVQMGESAGPVTHFSSHWHVGDDPDASDSEDHDPRLPSPLLDPLAVLDILVETFFPRGPDDVVPERHDT